MARKKAATAEEKAAKTPEGTRYRHPWKLRRFEVATTPERAKELEAEGYTLAPLSKAEAGTAEASSSTAIGGSTGAASTTPAGSTTTTTPASPAGTTTTPAGSSGSVTVNG